MPLFSRLCSWGTEQSARVISVLLASCVIPGLPLLPGMACGSRAPVELEVLSARPLERTCEKRSARVLLMPSGVYWILLAANAVERERTYQGLYSRNYRVATAKPAS